MADYAVSNGISFSKRYVKQREHAVEVLSKIKQRGDINVVASNTAPKNLQGYIEMVSLQDYFDALLPVICKDIELGLKLGAETYLFDPSKLKPKTKAHHIISDLRKVL